MKKVTIELKRYKEHVSGYGRLEYPSRDSKDTLEAIMKFSQSKAKEIGKEIFIYFHTVWSREENLDIYLEKHKVHGTELPYCDMVYYLDIYYQEK